MSAKITARDRALWLMRADTEVRRECISTEGDFPLHGWSASSWPNKKSQSGFHSIHTSKAKAIERTIASERKGCGRDYCRDRNRLIASAHATEGGNDK